MVMSHFLTVHKAENNCNAPDQSARYPKRKGTVRENVKKVPKDKRRDQAPPSVIAR